MIRAFQIAVERKDRGLRVGFLTSVFCFLTSVFCLLAGCAEPEEEPHVWEKVKIGDLVPYESGKAPQAQFLKTINLDVHIFEIPADNVSELDKIRKRLFIRPLRLKSYPAFSGNSFMVRFGQFRIWNEIQDLLLAADGKKIVRISLMLADGLAETVVVAGLDRPQTVFYTAADGSRQGANIGPGIVGLRIKAESIPGSKGVCDVVAYPVFSLPISSAIPQFNARVRLREFAFTAAAFGLKMSPGDFVFLGPKERVSDQAALGGLFFSNPQGNLFFSRAERKPPEHKPAVRVFLLVCSRMDY
ncbi:MAG: hypothetical protein ACYSYV_01855 [Planctomycetota bacterium]|jgi:hypothetical protein